MFPWENSKSGSVRGFQRVHKPYFEPFLPIFCDFLSFSSVSTLESCYIWFTISLGYPNAYLYCFCPRKIQNGSLLGVIRGYVNPIFSHFCLFLGILCLFLQFSTLELCYIWLVPSLEYLCAYVYSWCPGKIQNLGPSGGHINPF